MKSDKTCLFWGIQSDRDIGPCNESDLNQFDSEIHSKQLYLICSAIFVVHQVEPPELQPHIRAWF